jgi:hypothetical protein
VSARASWVLGALAIASSAAAHDLGVSRMELVERDDGSIHGRFTFAAREAHVAFDKDGHVAVDVKTDGASCVAGPVTTARDGDGLVVDEDFACARATTSIEAIAYFVTEMGGAHEDVARIVTKDATHEELLRAPHRALVLELHRPTRARTPRSWIVAVAVAAVALIALAIRSILKGKDER